MIELGAGVGAPSIAAALHGAAEVVITDREDLALQCAALSCRANGLSCSVTTGQGVSWSLDRTRMSENVPSTIGCPASCAFLDWSLPVPESLRGR